MNDMTKVTEPKSDQFNFDDFGAGPMTFKIAGVKVRPGQDQPVEISVEGSKKFYRPCKGMARVFVAAWGADSAKYTGRSITLYGDPKVRWGGLEVGGIRISHMSHIDGQMTLALTMSKGNRKPFVVKPLQVTQQAPASELPAAASEQPQGAHSASDVHQRIEKALQMASEPLREHFKLRTKGYASLTDMPLAKADLALAWLVSQIDQEAGA